MLEKEIVQIWQDNVLNYSAAVNQSRAIPDARTGLKPIHRKIIYEMYADKIFSGGKFKKCAYMVGQIIARFSEHGDQATYDALTRLAQPWIQRYPLLTFHGNVGSQFGDSQAAMRYTEAKLAPIAEEGLLANLKKETVDWIPNFTNEEEEPITLPALFPGLFCLPNQGIGFAVASNFLTFNLAETADMIINYIKTGELKTIYYDLASGGTFINPSVMKQIYTTGKGSIIIDANYKIDKNKIVFTELPFNVMLEDLLEDINKLCEKEELTGIHKVYNDSGNNELKLVVEIDSSVNFKQVINQLYHKTALRSSYGINQVALINNKPKLLTMKDMVEIYINHNLDCLLREYQFEFKKNAARLEILEGLSKALEDIDNIIQLIKTSQSTSVAKQKLIEKYNFTENQAKAILDLKLARLANLEKIEINNELAECQKNNANYLEFINFEDKRKEELIQRLITLANKFGDNRRTKIEEKDTKIPKEEKEIAEVEPEKCIVVLDEAGGIKRIPTSSFRTQKRNTKGVKTQSDITSMVLRTNTVDNLMIFTNQGKMYKILVDKIPVGTNVSKGTPVGALVEMAPGEKPILVYSIYHDTKAEYILFITKNGTVKKTALSEYTDVKKKGGIAAIKLREGDSLAAVSLINDEPIILVSRNGMAIQFNSTEITPASRATIGMKGMNIKDEDEIVAGIPVRDKTDELAVFAASGQGKRFKLTELSTQMRGGKGLSVGKEEIVSAVLVSPEDSVLLCGDKSSICISATEIPSISRAAIGNLLLKGNKIMSVSKI